MCVAPVSPHLASVSKSSRHTRRYILLIKCLPSAEQISCHPPPKSFSQHVSQSDLHSNQLYTTLLWGKFATTATSLRPGVADVYLLQPHSSLSWSIQSVLQTLSCPILYNSMTYLKKNHVIQLFSIERFLSICLQTVQGVFSGCVVHKAILKYLHI